MTVLMISGMAVLWAAAGLASGPKAPAAAESELTALGAVLKPAPGGLSVLEILPGSHADRLSLRPGDLLTHLEGRPAASKAEAAEAYQELPPGARLSAVVIRGLTVERLTGVEPKLEPLPERGGSELSARERLLKENRLNEVLSSARSRLNRLSWDFLIKPGQSAWIRFPGGFPEHAALGDVITAETTTPVPSNAELDYFSLPPKSRLWAKVIDAKGPPQTHNLRLFFFKIEPLGGGSYPCAAIVTDVSGNQKYLKATPGGTIVQADGVTPDFDVRAKIEFLRPLTLLEPPRYYQAGPGFWIKNRDDSLEITQVIAGRSAAQAGVKTGDALASINGRLAESYDFATALSLLYGERGSEISLGIKPADGSKHRVVSLQRGFLHKDGAASPVPFPYEKSPDAPNY